MNDGGITVHRTWLSSVVRELIEPLWPYISDDGATPFEEWEPRIDEDSRWYVSVENGQHCGVFWMRRVNYVTWEAHANVLPRFWGDKRGTAHCQQAITKMMEDTGAKKVVAYIPVCYPQVMEMAEQIGFVREGVRPKSWQKDGKLYDVVLYGITRT